MRRLLPICLLAALALAFFGSLLLAAASFPDGYNWKHSVMSSLSSPHDNPVAYRTAADGMAVSGILLSILGFYIRRSLRPYAPKWAVWATAFFVLGGILLTISALITPGHHAFLGLPKAHAKFAQAAGVGFGIAMAVSLPAFLRLPARQAWLRLSVVILVAVPVTCFLLCRIFLAFATGPAGSFVQQSILGSLAFWEWIGSVSVYLFTVLTVLGPPEH